MDIRENEQMRWQIRKALPAEWEPAMELAFRVFLKYEAADYGPEGIRNFAEFVTDESLKKMFLAGEYLLYVALDADKIVGLISLRSGNHISLLFVDSTYHRKGIGRELMYCLRDYMKRNTKYSYLTVYASPYGVPFYKRIGFVSTGVETRKDGMIYTPMKWEL